MTERATLIRLKAGGRSLTMDTASIRQIVRATALIRVPLTWPHVAGVMARDGRVIPVYPLLALPIEMDAVQPGTGPNVAAEGEMNQIVILEHEGALAGILVDGTHSVRGAAAPASILDGRALLTAAGALEHGSGRDRAAQTAEGET